MARTSNYIVDSGDLFPTLDMETVDHGQISLPGYWEGLGIAADLSRQLVTLLSSPVGGIRSIGQRIQKQGGAPSLRRLIRQRKQRKRYGPTLSALQLASD